MNKIKDFVKDKLALINETIALNAEKMGDLVYW